MSNIPFTIGLGHYLSSHPHLCRFTFSPSIFLLPEGLQVNISYRTGLLAMNSFRFYTFEQSLYFACVLESYFPLVQVNSTSNTLIKYGAPLSPCLHGIK